MKEHALKVFRQPPERLNCAQSVLHAWHEVMAQTYSRADRIESNELPIRRE